MSWISARIARCPSRTSVWTSGSGPSSRTEPTRTKRLSCVTSACMIPLVSVPSCDGRGDRAGLADGVERPHVVLVAVRAALRGDLHAEAGAVERRLDVVRRERVAREQDVDEPRLDERDHRRDGAGVDDTRPRDPEHPHALGAGLPHAVGHLAHQHGLGSVGGAVPVDGLEGVGRGRRWQCTDTRIPAAPTTMRMPARTSDMGTVRTRTTSACSCTARPQSISGFSTSCHAPSSSTRVSRLVVE